MADSTDDHKSDLATAQLEKLLLENEKLRLELSNLKRGNRLILLPYLPLITVLITLAGLGFGIYQYRVQQQANRVAQAETSKRDREAREPNLKGHGSGAARLYETTATESAHVVLTGIFRSSHDQPFHRPLRKKESHRRILAAL
jgi:hypothetical protein